MIRTSWNGLSLRDPDPFVSRIFWTIILGGLLAGVVAYAARAEGPQALAHECADSLARRDHLDHKGFDVDRHGHCVGGRCLRGSRAENVGYGCATEACQIVRWWRSPGHAANMRLGPISIASAVARSGRRYWCGVVPG